MPPTSDNSKEYLSKLREQLRFWPHTIHRIDDTLDIALIEGRGKQLLFQAINAKNLTAFVGSGLSAAYGRLTWRDWKKEQVRIVERNALRFIDLCDAATELQSFHINLLRPHADPSDPQDLKDARSQIHAKQGARAIPQKERHNAWSWLRARYRATMAARHHISGLRQTTELVQSSEGGFPGGEELPVQFEVAQKLQNELHKQIGLFIDLADEETPADARWEKARFGALEDAKTACPLDTLSAAEQLHNLGADLMRVEYDRHRETYKTHLQKLARALEWPEARLDFEMLAKTLLVDECAHAWLTLRNGLLRGEELEDADTKQIDEVKRLERDYLQSIFSKENLRRDIQGIRELPGRYRVLSPFRLSAPDQTGAMTLEPFKKMTRIEGDSTEQEIQTSWCDFTEFMNKTLDLYLNTFEDAGDPRRYLSPSARFLIPTFLTLLTDPQRAQQRVEAALQILPTSQEFTSRRSILADRHDPLPKITAHFGVKRFITTNYDFEIERYYQDRGYRTFPKRGRGDGAPQDTAFRTDPIGGVLKDQTFDRKRAAQLTSFALEQGTNDASVYHLHGRATVDDGLVVTEQDYMSLYLKQDEYRDTVDEGITMAFAASPVLFLGLGMEETDLLRPLRQFISNRDRTVGYTSFALLPAEKSNAHRTKFASALLLRYGVHTIYYGSGQIRIDGVDYGLDWLHRITQLINVCRSLTETWRDTGCPEDLQPTDEELNAANFSKALAIKRKIVAHISRKVGTIGEDLSDEDYPADTLALGVLLGLKNTDHADLAKSVAGKLKQADFMDWSEEMCLQPCVFTSTRPMASRPRTLHDTAISTQVGGRHYVGFHTGLLNELFRMTVDLPETIGTEAPADTQPGYRDLRARVIAFNGLQGGFLTGCLNAALKGIRQEQKSWLENWKQSPPFRQALLQCVDNDPAAFDGLTRQGLEKDVNAGVPTRYMRHRIDNVISSFDGLEEPIAASVGIFDGQGRIEQDLRTRIRAFDTFIMAANDAFRNQTGAKWQDNRCAHRQLITVAAHRGLGKGTFISAFSSRRGVSLYQRAVWQKQDVALTSAVFLNLGMSPEIASVYDMLQRQLIETICGLEVPFRRDGSEAGSKVELHDLIGDPDRHLRALRIFERYQNQPLNAAGGAFAGDGFEQVKEAARSALKRELHGVSRIRSLKLLLDRFAKASARFVKEHTNASSDPVPQPRLLLVLSAAELFFSANGDVKNGEISQLLDLLLGEAAHETPIDIVFIGSEAALGGHWSVPQTAAGGGVKRVEMRSDRAWDNTNADEHIRRRMEGGRIELDVFDEGWRDKVQHEPELHFVHVARPMSSIQFALDNFPVLLAGLHLTNPPESDDPGTNASAAGHLTNAKSAFRDAVKEGLDQSDKDMDACFLGTKVPKADEIRRARRQVADQVEGAITVPLNSHLQVITGDTTGRDLNEVLAHRLALNPHLREEWRNLRRYVGSSRIAITMLLAAAEHIIIHASDPVAGAEEAEGFCLSTVADVRSVGRARSDEMVLEAVLTVYRRLHRIGNPDLDAEFHLLILRHLAVIGTPVSASVIVRLPEFRDYFETLGIELQHSRRRFLFRALTVMAYRGLVFRIAPHPRQVKLAPDAKDEDWPAQDDFRWALHRLVQRFGVNKLKPHLHDPIVLNTFAPTLYTSIPSAGPKLSEANYKFLRSLLVGLSQYPDVPSIEHGIEPWLFTTDNRTIRAQALRAALSLVRSTLSIAVVSKLDERLEKNRHRAQKRGHLETYRVRLRWIVRMAWYMMDDGKLKRKNYDPAEETPWINALYRDEIVWLYNELGVTCLTQGNLTDALGYLRHAGEHNERIEGSNRAGPLFNHIDFNHAIVQFERGRFASARHRLERVKKTSALNNKNLHWAAEGYLCVLDHVSGRHDDLDRRFRSVTLHFQDTNDDRASAILLMHRARFLFRKDPGEARKLLNLSRSLLETSGHEDVRHHVELSLIRLRHAEDQGGPVVNGKDMRVLQDIENYARSMSIWSLQADSLRLRASILLVQGETSTAGRLLVRSMAIARRYSMSLRLNSAMTDYADVLLQRGDMEGGRHIAEMSLEQANAIGYRIEADRAYRVISRINTLG